MSIEPQRTHIDFDGLSNVFGALGAEIIAREVERRQCPNGRSDISKGGTGDILDILALTCTLGWQQRELLVLRVWLSTEPACFTSPGL